MTGPTLVCVPPNRVDEVWGRAEPLLGAAMSLDIADDDLASLKADLDKGDALLWLVWDDALLAAVTTKIMASPARKICMITACGGQDAKRWIGLITGIERYAIEQDCDVVRFTGRTGWKRMFPDYHEPWICLEKDLT